MEWVVFFSFLVMCGVKIGLYVQMSLSKGEIMTGPLPTLGRLPGETSLNDLTTEQLNNLVQLANARKSARRETEKVDWKKEGF